MKNNSGPAFEKDEIRRILIVDDEKDFVLSLTDILESCGYMVEKAHNEKEATEKIKEFNAHVALLDVRLGQESGINLIYKLKEAVPNLLSVMMTAYVAADTAIEALQEGAYDYLRKPLSPNDLLATLDRCFEKLRLEKEKSAAEEALKIRNKDLEEINARLKKIVILARTFTSCSGSDQIYRIMLETFAQNMAAEGGSLFLVEKDRLNLVHTIDPGHAPSSIPMPPDEGSVFDKVLKTKKPLLIKDIKRDDTIISNGWKGYNDGSFIAFPLPDEKGDIIGIISLHNKQPPLFTPQDKEIGSILASLCNETIRATNALETLRESEERYRLLVETMNDGLGMQDQNGLLTYVNDKLCEMTGFSRSELIGRPMTDFLDENNKRLYEEYAVKWLSGNCRPYEIGMLRKGEKTFPALISPQTIEDSDGHLKGLFAVITDISERKEAEEKRLEMESQLQQAQKMEGIGTLAGGIAHDFNNSLQGILGYTQMLLIETEKKDPKYSRLLQIEKAAQRASELIQQLLAFSRKVESQLRPIDLNQEVKQVEKLLQRTIPKMIDIELDLEKDLKIINADPAQVEQILMNLAVNARDAMGEEGTLKLETKNVRLDEEYCKDHLDIIPGDYVLLNLYDTGHGMDKETADQIFEPFFTTKETGEGTGLGLSMVYGLVKKHRGHITCHSEPEKGTCFGVYFPAIMDDVQEASGDSEIYPPPRGDETILIIDDEAIVRELGEQILTEFGYDVLTAIDGESGIKTYLDNKEASSLIILDLMMPGMGGQRCLEEILKVKPDQKVVIASGYAVDGHVKSAIDAGAKGFIKKPFDMREMLVVVREVLDGP